MSAAEVPDEESIRNIIGRYFQYTDDRDVRRGSLLSEDYRVLVNGQAYEPTGSPNSTGPEGRHLSTNTVVSVDGDTATASYDWIWVGAVGVPLSPHQKQLLVFEMGRTVDTFRRVNGEWKVASHDLRPLFFDPRKIQTQ